MGHSGRHRLFDHLVGLREQRGRDRYVERFGRLEIDCHLILGRCLHRKVAGLLAFKDAVNIVSGAPELINQIRSVGDETSGSNERPVEINSWQPVFCRKPDDEVAMTSPAGRQ
jgi:hypothetical protein